jgi:CIC family chloride channel protein
LVLEAQSKKGKRIMAEQNVIRPKKSRISRIRQSVHDKFFALSPIVRLNFLAIIVGIVGGIGAFIFRLMILFVYYILIEVPQSTLEEAGLSKLEWLPFLLAPCLGGIIVGLLTTRLSEETKGHGVPEVLESVALRDGRMNLRVPFVKILASALTIGSGGSAGREGPIAQIGAGFASFIGQKLDLSPRELRTLVIAGVAAGISATFNAPIGGTLFAVEVLMREGAIGLFVPIIVASVVGTVVGQLLLGDEPAFQSFPPLEYHNPGLIPFFVLVGVIAGISSVLWIKLFYHAEDLQGRLFDTFSIPTFLRPAIGGLCIGIILVISFLSAKESWEKYTTMGRTYAPMDAVFDGELTTGTLHIILLMLIALIILKALATMLTVGSGGSGGVFAPTLFLGVMLGAIFGVIARDVFGDSSNQIAVFALLGMAAFFAGTGRAPLTAIIMTAELTGDYFLTVPLMLAVTISWLISNQLEPNDIYVQKLVRRGSSIKTGLQADILESITIAEAMTPYDDLIIINVKARLEEVLETINRTGHEGFPVFEQDQFLGVITLSDVNRALEEHPRDWIVSDVLRAKSHPEIICMHKNSSLAHAVSVMVRRDVSRLPVVEEDKDGHPKLVGWLTHHDITKRYSEKRAVQALEDTQEIIFPSS